MTACGCTVLSVCPALCAAKCSLSDAVPFTSATDENALQARSPGRRMLYCWGSNSFGHFGDGTTNDASVPRKSTDLSIRLLASGSSHTLVATEDGRLFGCGSNQAGELGISCKHLTSTAQFVSVPFDERVKAIACGWEHTLLLTEDGRVFASGRGRRGQLGLGSELQQSSAFVHVPLPRPATQICCGVWLSLVLLENGDVWGWGSNRHGLLSPDGVDFVWRPLHLVAYTLPIRKLAAGHRHILALTRTGALIASGCNRFGQCQIVPWATQHAICDIYAGWHHSVVRTASNQLVLFGKNDHNQLAVDASVSFNILDFDGELEHVAIGAEHGLALVKRGDTRQLHAWGWNEHGILGQGHTDPHAGAPVCISDAPASISAIYCGFGSCFLTTSD